MAEQLPGWERLLAAAARLQSILPDATLVGGTAAAIAEGHRRSLGADHLVAGLVARFDEVLAELEAAAGWKTARVKRPVAILGSPDGILTTVRNQVREAPLETTDVDVGSAKLRVPTKAEILRIKAWLILQRNATRDFLDVAAISGRLTDREPRASSPRTRRDRVAQGREVMRDLLLEYDESVDAAYLRISDAPWDHQVRLDDSRGIDYAADGSVIGIEILSPRRKGVRLDGLPFRADVARVMQSVAFRILEGAR